MRPFYNKITELTDTVCRDHLSEEYAELARKMAATLCRKRPSPLIGGNTETWAGAILYALGQVNYLFDKSQTPHMRSDELASLFGIAKSTASAKAKIVKTILKMHPSDFTWLLPSRIDDWSPAWIIQVDGLYMDARDMPYEIQEEAAQRGLIPYLPEPTQEVLATRAYQDAIEWAHAEEPAKAKELLLTALRLKPDFVAAQLSLSEVYETLHDTAQSRAWASTAYQTTLKIFPSWPTNFTWHMSQYRPYLFAICNEASLLHIGGETEAANKLYRLLLKFTPEDNQGVRYLLAGMYAGVTPAEIDRLMDQGNDLQDWSVLEDMLDEQNAEHHFWVEPNE